ncbi:hypothetical protein C5O23_03695 [Duncaniella muris]|uniref:Uncharacterized protein n=1 Tax=Duncaniella muris TaxID=2094150 RepID=A0A2V1IR79_9BACT|nr:hypothetical protein [Duncaniella muris]PWB03260.1 hypothetical protein C5O23_03695 [Duncaniella muris]
MPKVSSINPTEEQSRFYEQIFDDLVFDRAIKIIETLLKEEKSYLPLRSSLQKGFGYDNVVDIEHYHNNKYFDPNYKTVDKGSCDFLMIGIWVDFKKRIAGLDDVSVASKISIVWNDVKSCGWIKDVTIYFSKSSTYYMKPLCTTDLSGREIINWKWRGKLPVTDTLHKENKYTDDSSHITSIDDLEQFISFLIHKEKIPCKIHAFEDFGNLIHPKTGMPLYNEYKATQYTRLLNEGYSTYVKLHRKTSYDSFLMALQRKVRNGKQQ